MNKVKRILCLCTAFLLISGATSCNSKNKNDDRPEESETSVSSDKNKNEIRSQDSQTSASSDDNLQKISKNVITEYFDSTQLSFGDQIDLTSIKNIKYKNDKIYFIASGSNKGDYSPVNNSDIGQSLYVSDTNGNIEREIPIKDSCHDTNIFYDVSVDGEIYYIGLFHEIDPETGYVYKTEEKAIYKMNSDNQCEKIFDIPAQKYDVYCLGFFVTADEKFCVCTPDENDLYNVFTYNKSGELISTLPIMDPMKICNPYLCSVVNCENKILFFIGTSQSNSYVVTLNTEDMTFGDTVELQGYVNMPNTISGNNGYDFYYPDENCIYGYKIDTGKSAQIIQLINTDVFVSPDKCTVIDPETIICIGEDQSVSSKDSEQNSEYVAYKFNKADEERLKEINSKKAITISGLISSEIICKIKEFNIANDEYRIQAKDCYNYLKYKNSLPDRGVESGNIPDIIIFNDESDLVPYFVKGELCDLGKFIDDDKDMNREDFMSNIFDLYTYKSCLYAVVPVFLDHTIVAKTSCTGDKPGWTYDEFFDFINNNKDTVEFDEITGYSNHNIKLLTAYAKDHIDLEKRTCDFNNEEFIKLIEVNKVIYSHAQDYFPQFFKNNDMLMSMKHFDSVAEYYEFQHENAGESITFKGFPSESGISKLIRPIIGFTIPEQSENKDGAWLFIRQFLLEDYQDNIKQTYYGWPVRKSSLKKYIYEKPSADDSYYRDQTVKINGEKIEIVPIPEAEKQKFMDYLQAPAAQMATDSKIMQIVIDQIRPFHQDKITAEEAAAATQNKMELYLNELN